MIEYHLNQSRGEVLFKPIYNFTKDSNQYIWKADIEMLTSVTSSQYISNAHISESINIYKYVTLFVK